MSIDESFMSIDKLLQDLEGYTDSIVERLSGIEADRIKLDIEEEHLEGELEIAHKTLISSKNIIDKVVKRRSRKLKVVV